MLQQKPLWEEDHLVSACNSCRSNFTFINRRHHCRNCGRIFCDDCTLSRANLRHFGYTGLQRVCKNCIKNINESASKDFIMVDNQNVVPFNPQLYNQPPQFGQNMIDQNQPNPYPPMNPPQNLPYNPQYQNNNYNNNNIQQPLNVQFVQGNINNGNPLATSNFFKNAAQIGNLQEYIVILDQSGSMSNSDGHHKSRWQHAEASLNMFTNFLTRANPSGFDLYLFNDKIEKFCHVKDQYTVGNIMRKHRPTGSTDLALALELALNDHFERMTQTNVLVITDGEPNSENAVFDVIGTAANRLNGMNNLSITFLQIGHCEKACCFLERLHEEFECRNHLVETITYKEFKHMGFHDFISNSIEQCSGHRGGHHGHHGHHGGHGGHGHGHHDDECIIL